MRRRTLPRRLGVGVVAVGLTLAGVATAAPTLSRSQRFPRAEDAHAVALAPDGRAAVGDARGVWLAWPGRPATRLARLAGVSDLAFDASGALWVASGDGLHRIPHTAGPGDAASAPETRTPAPGARPVHRLAIDAGWIACATRIGVFAGPVGGTLRPLGGRLARADVTALAWRARADRARPTLAALAGGRLLVVDPDDAGSAEAVPLPDLGGAPSDLAAWDARLLVLATRALAIEHGERRFRTLPLALPPGADPARFAVDGGRLWLATARGAFSVDLAPHAASASDDPGPRAIGAATRGDAPELVALAAVAGRVLAAGPGGVVEGPMGDGTGVRAAGPGPGPVVEPTIGDVHRMALSWLGLGPARMRALARRVGRRGWLPDLELRGGYGGGRSHALDVDETFSSGEARVFHDLDLRRGRDFDVSAVLRWELGDVVYHPEMIDVARETREWIELRDEVLDELTLLYFERRRVLTAAAGAPSGEAAALRLRAEELAAGIDAWTGGAFGAAVRAAGSPPRSRMEPTP